MKIRNVLAIISIYVVVFITFFSSVSLQQKSYSTIPISENVVNFINEVNVSKIIYDTLFLSSLNSRVLGYEGFYRAMEYIIAKFNKYTDKVTVHEYKTAMPIEKGSRIYIGPPYNLNVTAYALWPNGGISVSTLKNYTGKIYYVGEGNFADLDGVNLAGSIILMDFNSGRNWLRVASLGAKAVVFIEPSETNQNEALLKGSMSPLNFPRLYVDSKTGEILKSAAERGVPVTINTEMRWEEITGYNIIGEIEGELKDDVIIISTHFDSWSIVPSLSPSAEEAVSTSILLELARCFSKHRPTRTIWLVAYSGHWEGCIGPTEFVEHVMLNSSKRIWTQIGIDISSETPQVDFLNLSPNLASSGLWQAIPSGSFVRTPQFALRFDWVKRQVSDFLSKIDISGLKREESIYTGTHDLLSLVKFNFDIGISGSWAWGWWGTQTSYYILDTEPSLAVDAISFTIRTQYARRSSWLTPLNNFGKIKWNNIIPQTWIISAVCYYFANAPSFGVDWSSIAPKRFYVGVQYILGFSTLSGQTVEFNPETGWYTPIPRALVRMMVYAGNDEHVWPFAYRYKVSDEDGKFIFYGLVPYTPWALDAWKFDENTGDIAYSLDQGFYGLAQGVSGGLTNIAYPLTERVSVLLPMFKCVPVTLFDLIDLRRMRRVAISDVRPPYHMFFSEPARLEVFESASRSRPLFYYVTFGSDGVGVICVKNGTTISITFNPNINELSKPLIILTNSSDDNREGHGYIINEPLIIANTLYKSAEDIYRMCMERYEKLREFQVRSLYAEECLRKAEEFLVKAKECYANLSWSKFYVNSVLSLSYSSQAYMSAIMPLYNEASFSTIFFSFLILPFSILFEKLIFSFYGKRKFISLFAILLFLFAVFALIHPSIRIMANAPMAVIGVGVLLMLIFVSTIFTAEIKSMLTEISVRLLGYHEFKTERVSAVLHTVSSSVENMRRRKLQTMLIFLMIISFTAALTSLTSTSYTYLVSSQSREATPIFTGILIKSLYGYPPESRGGVFDEPLIDFLENMVGQDFVVSPRIWVYPPYIHPSGCIIEIISKNKTQTVVPGVILGISDEEMEQILSGYVESQGFSHFSGENQIFIPSKIAETLGVNIGDKVYIKGFDVNLTYIGSFAVHTNLYDIDQYYWAPIDPGFELDLSLIPSVYPPGAEPWAVSLDNVLIVPWKTAYKMGGFISSVSLIPKRSLSLEEMKKLADIISEIFDVQVHVAYQNRVFTSFKLLSYTLLGWELTPILVAISFLSIMNFMLGSLILRRKEIFTYASLGLSPAGAMLIFLIEGVTVSFGGTIFGYLLGFGLNRLFISLGILPGYFVFNFVSLSVIISIVVLILSAVLSSIYPSYIASKMITPSLERKWKIETKPRGDVWEISIPIILNEKEMLAMLNYLREYYLGAGSQKSSFRIDKVLLKSEDKSLLLDVTLAPIESGISQEVCLKVIKIDDRSTLDIILTRKSGNPGLWKTRSYFFIDDLRKQILLWRSLPPSEKSRYFLSKNT
ncbi:MAG: FtsX-like permease family protein [Candidatus Bathyarchaeia archaeon]